MMVLTAARPLPYTSRQCYLARFCHQFDIMAFTLAHPAAVLPFRHLSFLSLLPLVVGSMTPDLIGFLPYTLEHRLPHSHSPIGTVLIDLPVDYLILIVLLLFRKSLLQPLWEPHRSCIAAGMDDFFQRRRAWLIALPSLLIGSWTHILWDRFTHFTYWTYLNLPWLYRPLFPDATHELPLFHVLQYVTSIIGLLILGWYYLQHLQQQRRAHPVSANSRFLHWLLLGIVMLAGVAGIARWLAGGMQDESIYSHLSLVTKTAIMSFTVLYLLSGLILARITTSPRQLLHSAGSQERP
jgi:Domain of unknown function (DUF4184)